MITLIYNDTQFKDQIKELAKKYNISIDAFKDKTPKAFKVKGRYGTKLVPFCVYKDSNIEIPFYSEVNDCTIEHIEEILNRYATI